MAKPNIPSQKSRYASLNQRLNKYLLLVQQIFDDLNLEAAKAATSVDYDPEGGKPFRFSDYPTLKKRVDDLKQRYVDDIGAVIFSGTSSEWKKSNEVQDLLADGVLKAYGAEVHGRKYKIYYQTNSDALKAFQKRKANGMTLSQKLWNQAVNYKDEMEYAISSAIEKGTSAVTLSKRLSKYLQDFPSLQKDYKEKFGKKTKCQDCEYRSMRLARSEINMAYRAAEHERWQQMDFVVGYEIKLSGSHPAEDICDMLKGKYPKDFVWSGWHPNDICYKIPILKTEEEFWNYGEAKDQPSSKEVNDVPDAFKEWVADNDKRISTAKRNGTLPFFLKDNPSVMKERVLWTQAKEMRALSIAAGDEVQGLAESIAAKFGGTVTPINYKSFGSICRKCKTENCSPFDLKDAVRNTIIVDEDKIEDVLKALEDSGAVLRVKRQTPDKFMGYSGNIVNISTSNGRTAEIQVNTAKMIYAKETPAVAKSILGEDVWNMIAKETGLEGGHGHKYYEEFRVLDKLSPKAIEIEKQSKEYYSHFSGVKRIATKSVAPAVDPGYKEIAEIIESTMISYSPSMHKQSAVIRNLLDELYSDSVQKGDPKERVALINKIKKKSAVLTRWNLRKTGAVDGLDFVALRRNTSFYDGGPLKVSKTGEVVHTRQLIKDVLEFKDKSGKSFYYPLGARDSVIPYKANEASEIIDSFLPGMKAKIKGLFLDTGKHPKDAFYRREYDGFVEGWMYAGDIISVHKKIQNAETFRRLLAHEVGHKLDGGMSKKVAWKDAMKKDGNFCTSYAQKHVSEDFAESFSEAYMIIYHMGLGVDEFSSKYPNRWKILEGIFKELENVTQS